MVVWIGDGFGLAFFPANRFFKIGGDEGGRDGIDFTGQYTYIFLIAI
jgi:hypothetical protein